MPKPRFKTLLRQAREQCLKEFDAYDMQINGEIIVKFFASGMEYRMNHSHVLAERTFLNINNPADFLMGYLQGKGADADMIEKLEENCRFINNGSINLVDVFTRGLFYEEFLLEPNTLHDLVTGSVDKTD